MSARTVITSIPPRLERTVQGNPAAGAAYQAHCVRSWIKAGFEVISLNAADELPALAAAYPEVSFEVAPRTARELWGAPLVPICDLVACLRRRGHAVAGIINADVFTMADRAYFDRLLALCEGGVAYGMRLDVSDLSTDAQIEFYAYGYDYFFFDVARAEGLPADYVIGMPWWDLWFPLALSWSGVRLHRIFSPTVFHLKHPERTGGQLDREWRHFFDLTRAQVTDQLARSADPLFKQFCGGVVELGRATWQEDAIALGKMVQGYLAEAAVPHEI